MKKLSEQIQLPKDRWMGMSMIVKGRVQGVGFRVFVSELAKTERLGGWVKNKPDGSVGLKVVGSRNKLEKIFSKIVEGFPGCQVASYQVRWEKGPSGFSNFEILRSRE